jgi:predicted NBD/HSP70 family sugar kinase
VSGAEGLVPVALGIEIGGTKLQSAVVAADGRVLLRRSDRVDPAGGAEGNPRRARCADRRHH